MRPRRVIYRIRVVSSAFIRVYCDSCAIIWDLRSTIRFYKVVNGTSNALAAFRILEYCFVKSVDIVELIRESRSIRFISIRFFIVEILTFEAVRSRKSDRYPRVIDIPVNYVI